MKPPPPNALVNKVVALTLVLLMFAGTLGLGAVWVRQEIFSTANRSRVLQTQIADVERKLDEVRAQVATAESVAALIHRSEDMRLALVSPRELQVVRVEQDPTIELGRKRNAEALLTRNLNQNADAFAFRIIPASYAP
jgi:C4-dicarboxylate-specific signal transduction histidine kinase